MYLEAIEKIEAHESLNAIKCLDFPHLKDESREKTHKKLLEKSSINKERISDVMTTEQAFTLLRNK